MANVFLSDILPIPATGTAGSSISLQSILVQEFGAGYVTQLYLNVLNRTPGADELNAWLDLMHNHGFTRDMTLVGFAESPENIAKTSADWLIVI